MRSKSILFIDFIASGPYNIVSGNGILVHNWLKMAIIRQSNSKWRVEIARPVKNGPLFSAVRHLESGAKNYVV